jgi:hypothetical protein
MTGFVPRGQPGYIDLEHHGEEGHKTGPHVDAPRSRRPAWTALLMDILHERPVPR